MILSSRMMKLGVMLASASAHGLFALLWWGEPEVRIAGGAEAAVQARMGNSFADMAAGTLTPETPDTIEEVELTEVAEPVTPDTPPDQSDPAEVTTFAQTEATPKVEPQPATERAEAVTVPQSGLLLTESQASTEQLKAPAPPTEAIPPTSAPALVPIVTKPNRADRAVPTLPELLTSSQTVAKPQVLQAIPARPTITVAAPPRETLQALPEEGVQISRRPQVRPKRIEQKAQQRRAAQQQKPKRHAQRGNAQQNAVAGSEAGINQATATRQSTNANRSNSAGNAAARNYPGRVMRCISRAGRPRVKARGTAVVAFTVGSKGRVRQVGLAKSSGHARLDRAAIQTIARAGPCPPPPTGAKRFYRISIKGRG